MSQKFKSDIEAQAGIRDSSGAIGTSGQVLSSTGSNVSWINQTTVASDVQNQVKAGVAINKGQAVYVTGADGTNIIVGLASNISEATSSKTLGLLNATVSVNGFADVVQIGRLSGLNTIGATAGDPVWLGTNGNLIYGLINKPYAPAHLVFIGIVTRVNANNGEIFVSVQNGFELKEIHDVDIITNVPINGDILGYDGTLWVNKTIAEWLGFTPANASGTTNYVSKFTGANSLGDSQIFDNGTNVGIGTATPTKRLDVVSSTNDSFDAIVVRPTNQTQTLNIGWQGIATSLNFIVSTNGSEKMRVDTAGNVGIGTTTPTFVTTGTTTLDVNGSTGAAIYLRANIAQGSYLRQTSNNLVIGNNTYGDVIYNTGFAEAMRVTVDRLVGIGTSAPSEKLDVYGVVRGLFSGNPGTGGITGKFLTFSPSPYGLTFRGYGTGTHSIQVQRESNDAEVFSLSLNPNGGSVGIGTTTPTQKLEVVGNARITGALYDSSNSPGTSGQVLSSTGSGTAWTTGGGGGSQNLQQVTDVGNTTTNIIYFNGNVPIYGVNNSPILGATNLPNGSGVSSASNETIIGVYNDVSFNFETGIYAKRNIYCSNGAETDLLLIASPNSTVDCVIKIGNGDKYFIAKLSLIIDWPTQKYTYKIIYTNTTNFDNAAFVNELYFTFEFPPIIGSTTFAIKLKNNTGTDIYANINANIL